MSCKKNERKISDLLDGRLSEKQTSILENHISRCPECREYKNQLMLLSSKVKEREKNEMPNDYALEFSIRLKRRLLNEQQQKKQKKKFPGFEKWAYSAAGFIIVLFLVLYFVVLQPTSIQTEEFYVLSFEDALGGLFGEINNDAELEELFNTMILVSLNAALGEMEEETIPFILENPLYGEDLSEEDLKTLETKMKLEEDIKS
jgi:hypothetical protein